MANNVLRAGITPDDGSAQGFPSASTPHDGSLPLIGDTFMEQPNGPSACRRPEWGSPQTNDLDALLGPLRALQGIACPCNTFIRNLLYLISVMLVPPPE